jgi:flavin-dependent dehydrogenase
MTAALVVGAGPAGAVAALVLARAGVDVRLIDRADFPRHKLCGDTLNPGSLGILDRLGLGDRVRAGALPISGMVVTGPRGATVACDYPSGLAGAAIARRDLDSTLLDAAIAAGVDFLPAAPVRGAVIEDGTRVTGVRVGSAGQRIAARVVIAADGRRSRLGFALGLTRLARAPRRWAFGAYFTGVEGLTPRGEMHVRTDGYTGVAGLGGGVANVCVVRELAAGKSERIPSDQMIARALTRDPLLRERFAHARQESAVTALGPLAVEARAAGCPGLLLAGDAAGFVDPMTGDGLRFALRGGELAAEAALFELQTGIPAYNRLADARRREFSGKWRVNRALRALVASPAGVRIAAAMSSCWGLPVQYLIGLAGDVALARCGADLCGPQASRSREP